MAQVRESGVVGAQRRRRRCVRVAGRLCASGVAGAREMVAAGKTKLMHSLFPIRFVFSHFSGKTGMSINDLLNENILLS